MDKKFIKPIILFVIFIAAVMVFSIITNTSNADMTTNMSEASLPVITFQFGDDEINALYGYVDQMEMTSMRGNITPIGDDRVLSLLMDTDGKDIDEIAYEIRSLDGSRLMAENTVDYQVKDNTLTAEIKVENILTLDEEYSMVFTVTSGKDKIYYYTRIMESTDSQTDLCLAFAEEFHDETFNSDGDGTYFANYVDAATGDTTTFNYVDLTCTARQIMWKGFDCSQVGDYTIDIDEITDNYNAITLNYILTSVTEGGEIEYYNVEEYFRLRQGSTQMFVLDYERTANQIFQPENSFLYDSSAIQLGISDGNTEYVNDENGDNIAFVKEGELWNYSVSDNELSKVFSFRSEEGFERRECLQQHGIKIMQVDEAGSVDFIVYGYMNRGDHEGQVGISVNHYDGLSHNCEEEAFIPVYTSYSVLDSELGELMYENDKSQVYLTLYGKLYQIDLNEKTVSVAVENLTEGCYTASASNRYFAYVETDSQYSSSSFKFMDLSTGEISEISAGEGEYIRPLGFIDDNLIYGLANASDVMVDAAGTTTFPMKTLRIVSSEDSSHAVLKEYSPSGSYIGSISVEGYIVSINLIANSSGQYVTSGSEEIMNREADTETTVYMSSYTTDTKETEYLINFKETPGSGSTKLITSKQVIASESTDIDLDLDLTQDNYLVYVKGNAIAASDNISTAILKANSENAVVVDQNQNYVWQRSRAIYKDPMSGLSPMDSDASADSITKAMSALLARAGASVSVSDMISQGYTPKQVMEMTLKEERVLDLTGCTADEMLYYVDQGTPVFALTSASSAVLITGYTSNLIYYYDPSTDSTSSVAIADGDTLFYNAGNVFFTYIQQ